MTMLDERIEEMPPAPSRRPKWLVLVLVVVLLAAVTLFLGYNYVKGSIDPKGEAGADVTVTIKKDIGTEGVAKVLADAGVIKSERVFMYWTKIQGKGPYQAGTYTLQKNSTYDEVAGLLTKGPDISVERLTIPEGLTIDQIADRVGKVPGRSADTFKALAKDQGEGRVKSPLQPPGVTNLEGLLFPSTYFVDKDKDDERRILQKMVDAMASVTSQLDAENRIRARNPNFTTYQLLTIASMVEREAKVDDDRPLVSQVIYNRLEKNQKLQIDATVIYAQGLSGKKTRVTNNDLKVVSPYNTYLVDGLPPTPIAAAGEAAIRASLEPAPGDFLFYVVIDKDGRHAFARTGAEHQQNIERARANGVRD
jgi:UPF0755 protein